MEEGTLFQILQQWKKKERAMEKRHRQEGCIMQKRVEEASTQWHDALNTYVKKRVGEFNVANGVDLSVKTDTLYFTRMYAEFDLDDVPVDHYLSFIVDQILCLYHEHQPKDLPSARLLAHVTSADLLYVFIAVQTNEPPPPTDQHEYYISIHDVEREHRLLIQQDPGTPFIPILKRVLRNPRHPAHALILDGLYFVFQQFPRRLHEASNNRPNLWADKTEEPNPLWLESHAHFKNAVWFEDLKTLFATTHFIAMQYDYTDDYRNTQSPTVRYTDDLDNVYSIWIGKRETRNHSCFVDQQK